MHITVVGVRPTWNWAGQQLHLLTKYVYRGENKM